MSWTIAGAKQQFSEVVRLCAEEPQAVYKRSRQVAVVISADDHAAFEAWRRLRQAPPTLGVAGLFAPAREALREAGVDELELPPRADRPVADVEPVADEGANPSDRSPSHPRDAAQ